MIFNSFSAWQHLLRELSNFIKSLESSWSHSKEQAFIKRLVENRNSILTFLTRADVPPDNNASDLQKRMTMRRPCDWCEQRCDRRKQRCDRPQQRNLPTETRGCVVSCAFCKNNKSPDPEAGRH